MTTVETIRRISSKIFNCGKNKVWLDPHESLRFKNTVTRQQITELISDNLIIKKPNRIHSKYHTRKRQAEVAKGRHRGPGKVRGTKNALFPEKRKWINKIREMRETLKSMRESGELSAKEHKDFYMQAKGNLFKNNTVMCEVIAKKKDEEKRLKELEEQAAAIAM